MSLVDQVRIAPRFQRAVRIDADLGSPAGLDGFICTPTFARALSTLAEQVARTGHGAFTWTGPYGGGKSSLVITLAALLSPPGKLRQLAIEVVGRDASTSIVKDLRPGSTGWRVIPVVGHRAQAAELIAQSLRTEGLLKTQPPRRGARSDAVVLEALDRSLRRSRHAGLLLVIDELGKTFEYAAATGGDLHFFQQLAELASRSEGRLIVLGILHQAFDEYAVRLAREQRDEWAKVQGRFLDIPLQISVPEQLEIVSRAITSRGTPKAHIHACEAIAEALHRYRPQTDRGAFGQLKRCWPLHPVTACLLGPISRRRFGQNQRTLFGFLNSSEPQGFQEFLNGGANDESFGPDRLWDYLQANLEPAILASSDGHRWSLAVDAVERCAAKGGSLTHLKLVKAIALLDLLRDRSGLYASEAVLRTAVPAITQHALRSALADLKQWSIVVYREHLGAFAIYAGSDFDIEAAVELERRRLGKVDLSRLSHLANLRPVVAKRHYHDTGALRWFDVDLVAATEVDRRVREFKANGAMGQFLLVLREPHQSSESALDLCKEASKGSQSPVALGLAHSGDVLKELAEALIALEHVRQHRPELGGDAVARREVEARLAVTASILETEVRQAFDAAQWWLNGRPREVQGVAGLSQLASELADETFPDGPRIPNELLNRSNPSSNAVAARRALLHAMVTAAGAPRLGIEGFPAEGGLYVSLLEATGLYCEQAGGGYAFQDPSIGDPWRLASLWRATDTLLAVGADRLVTAEEVYGMWRAPPFGVREGLKPVLFVAYLLAREQRYTIYRDQIFEPRLTDILVDTLLQDPKAVGLRVFDIDSRRRRFFEAARDIAHKQSPLAISQSENTEPIDVAKALVALLQAQPKWVLRTNRLSAVASAVRVVLKDAEDPNRLLFEDLPRVLASAARQDTLHPDRAAELLREGLAELTDAYSGMLSGLEAGMRQELGAASDTKALAELRTRAERVKGLTGDFRLEAFVMRLLAYDGAIADFEGIASLAANKPPRDWSDNDVDRAALELADLAQRFNRAEAFARVKGRRDGRHAVAFVVGLDHSPELTAHEFEIPEAERPEVLKLVRQLQAMLTQQELRDEVMLGALAKVGSNILAKMIVSPRRRANG